MKDMKHWRREAKRWLDRNHILTGYNGEIGAEERKDLIESLAKRMEKIYNLPSSD